MEALRAVDLTDWRSADAARRARFVDELGAGLADLGFVRVHGSGLDPHALAAAYGAAESLFALPIADKLACERPDEGRQRGYTPFGTEHAKDRAAADLKEFWQLGRPGSTPGIPDNVFPDGHPELAEPLTALFATLESVALDLLDAIGAWARVPEGALRALAVGGNSVLRVIHYPPVLDASVAGAVRAAAHEDINLITLLPSSTDSGLELLTRGGRWLAVAPEPGALIVDTGDMMALLTGGRLPATTHRVVNPDDPARAARSRFSLPFFAHPRPDARLAPFGGPPDAGPLAGDFLHERLVAIGVARPAAG